MRLKWPKSLENHKAQFPKFSGCVDKHSMSRHYYMQNVNDKVLFRMYQINNKG